MVIIKNLYLDNTNKYIIKLNIKFKTNNFKLYKIIFNIWKSFLFKTFIFNKKLILLYNFFNKLQKIFILKLKINILYFMLLINIINKKLIEKKFKKYIFWYKNYFIYLKQNNINYVFLLKSFRCYFTQLINLFFLVKKKKILSNKVFYFLHKKYKYIYKLRYLNLQKIAWKFHNYYYDYFNYDKYNYIVKLLHEYHIDRENYIKNFIKNLHNIMVLAHLKAEIHGRSKNIYSIWCKMNDKSLSFHELCDIRAVRIIANHLEDCYIALKIIHMLYNHLPNKFDDYVIHPKPNGYQSIHTVILGPQDKIIEIQIRTKQMHKNAELGIAAHWKYKRDFLIKNKKNFFNYKNYIIFLNKIICGKEKNLNF